MLAAVIERAESVEVEGGAIPVHVLSPEGAGVVPGLVVVPSIFGPAPDLSRRLSALADAALVAVVDPFWRAAGGVVPYDDPPAAIERLQGFDRRRFRSELRAVIDWIRERCNGRVAGLGICFGGPYVLLAAGEGALAGVVTWHGSRMEGVLDRAGQIRCPLRFHFGDADPITPPEVIARIREAFASHPDAMFAIHPGADHGFSHDGRAFDAVATGAGLDDTRALLESL
jgi:carboxymethylenebutenolidase